MTSASRADSQTRCKLFHIPCARCVCRSGCMLVSRRSGILCSLVTYCAVVSMSSATLSREWPGKPAIGVTAAAVTVVKSLGSIMMPSIHVPSCCPPRKMGWALLPAAWPMLCMTFTN